ncbi:MAG: hypothetical protein WC998_01435 [Candidatus Paceibacterota bacterium]|jgi:hypothetical protein
MAGKPRQTVKEQIENAREGDIVHLPAGTIDLSNEALPINIPKGVVIDGEGKDTGLKTTLLPQGSESGLYAGEGTPVINLDHCIIAIAALDRISVIHNHPGICSKNCPALIAKEALRKIRG